MVLQGRVAARVAVQIARHQPYAKGFLTKVIGVTRENVDTLNASLIQAPADYHPR